MVLESILAVSGRRNCAAFVVPLVKMLSVVVERRPAVSGAGAVEGRVCWDGLLLLLLL